MNASTEPMIGWLELSQQSLARLQQELADKSDGVVDEMGMLTIHASYADRFFPGLSVLQTRARYLLFVPWCLLQLKEKKDLRSEMNRLNLWLASTLANTMPDEPGIIGRTLLPYNRVPSQPPDFIYWTALNKFGIYRGPARRKLFAQWPHFQFQDSHGLDGGVLPIDDLVQFDVPKAPSQWGHLSKLNFDLSRVEATFLVDRLATTDSLLGDLAQGLNGTEQLSAAGGPWDEPLVERTARARGESDAMERARDASALATAVRGIYGALVEQRRNRDQNTAGDHYYEQLRKLCFDDQSSSLLKRTRSVDPEMLIHDGAAPLLRELLRFVVSTCEALHQPEQLSSCLLSEKSEAVFRHVEVSRKGIRRARLAENANGQRLRSEFGDTAVRVHGLDYRWTQARRMLNDLSEGLRR